MYTEAHITSFILPRTGITTLAPEDDLVNDHGICGDELNELMEAYAKHFGVEMSGYCWYFHSEDEAAAWSNGMFSMPEPVPKGVFHIPLTPGLLLQFANRGGWDHPYPTHTPPGNGRSGYLVVVLIGLLVVLTASFCHA